MSPDWDLSSAVVDCWTRKGTEPQQRPHSNGFHFRSIASECLGPIRKIYQLMGDFYSPQLPYVSVSCELNQMWIFLSIIQIVGLSINPNLCPRGRLFFFYDTSSGVGGLPINKNHHRFNLNLYRNYGVTELQTFQETDYLIPILLRFLSL